MIILGIETSCDETAAAILEIRNRKIEIRSNVVSSQVKIHAQYGGIVPEVAARKHAENIIPVLSTALAALNSKSQIPNSKQILNSKFQVQKRIDAIAVTNGPGLITSLLVGVEAAKTLAFLWQKPLIFVNHLAGHIYANFVHDADTERRSTRIKTRINADISENQRKYLCGSALWPAICLVVSGGHTELVLMRDFEKFEKIGQTLDDAAGECFDKVAKILGLGYPGGPAIAAHAAQFPISKSQIPNKSQISNSKFQIKLPRPIINSGDFNFSFSGLKTAVLYKTNSIKRRTNNKKFIQEMCYEVQQAIIDVLIEKTIRAAKKFQVKSIILGGGVVANDSLRESFKLKIKNQSTEAHSACVLGARPSTKDLCSGLKLKINLLIPSKNLCTDNAAMIAAGGYFQLLTTKKQQWRKKFDWRKIKVDPNLEIN